MNLSVMYRATQAISDILDIDALSPQILDLVFESIGADRGAILLKDESGQLVPKAVRWREGAQPDERMTISQTIVDYVLEQGEGVITSDAPTDKRFSPAQSIVDLPDPRGHLRADPGAAHHPGRHLRRHPGRRRGPSDGRGKTGPRGRFSQDQLMLMVAIGHQAGLAIENTIFYNDKIQAERLAAVGQTIATLSHHIKNILQGIRGGSSLIDLGLKEKDDTIVRRGWTIVEKNQTKIYNMVMDMLSFSKDREPALEPADLNETIGDVVELMQSRAARAGRETELASQPGHAPGHDRPRGHPPRRLEHRHQRHRRLRGSRERPGRRSRPNGTRGARSPASAVSDNGVGIDEDDIPSIFQIFASSKGSRGTGLGLPVSQKIIREHGGKIIVTSRPGHGATFLIELPMAKRADPKGRQGTAEGLTMFE